MCGQKQARQQHTPMYLHTRTRSAAHIHQNSRYLAHEPARGTGMSEKGGGGMLKYGTEAKAFHWLHLQLFGSGGVKKRTLKKKDGLCHCPSVPHDRVHVRQIDTVTRAHSHEIQLISLENSLNGLLYHFIHLGILISNAQKIVQTVML